MNGLKKHSLLIKLQFSFATKIELCFIWFGLITSAISAITRCILNILAADYLSGIVKGMDTDNLYTFILYVSITLFCKFLFKYLGQFALSYTAFCQVSILIYRGRIQSMANN